MAPIGAFSEEAKTAEWARPAMFALLSVEEELPACIGCGELIVPCSEADDFCSECHKSSLVRS